MSDLPNPTAPLWSDERVHRDLFNCHTPRGYYKDDEQYIAVIQAEALAVQMRDQYEAKLVELEAKLILVSRELVSTDNAERYYRGFNAGYELAESRAAQALREVGKWVEQVSSDPLFMAALGGEKVNE
jgi:hypothetical protein